MNFKITLLADEEYYKEAYDEMLSLTKVKKWEPLLASIMIIFGIGLYYFNKDKLLGFLPILFVLVGFYEFYKFYTEKKKWLKDRADSKILGQNIEMEFKNESIKHSGPFSNGEFTWSGLKVIKKTKKGIILKPENGVSIYFPDKIFKNQDEINFILSKGQ